MNHRQNALNRNGKPVSQTIDILFVGAALAATKSTFGTSGTIRCEHAGASADAIEIMASRGSANAFDCVMVDMRYREDGTALNVVAIAALQTSSTIVVLCQPEQVDTFRQLTGVHTVLPAPVQPRAILDAVTGAVERRRRRENRSADRFEATEDINDARDDLAADFEPVVSRDIVETGDVNPASDIEPELIADDYLAATNAPESSDNAVTPGFEASISKAREVDQEVWQRFVPIANFVYKKLAIILLSALFLTFIAYGAMIVFFMTSSSWSLPFELSRGHQLVEKTERDLSTLRLRRNQVQQEIDTSLVDRLQARREKRDGEKQLTLTLRTVEQEVLLQNTQKTAIEKQIARLKKVMRDFDHINGRGGFAKTLNGAYARRLITRKSLNSGTLAILETMHRLAVVKNEVAEKEFELQRTAGKLRFLESLLQQIQIPEINVITSAGSELAYLARDVIEAKNRIALAERTDGSLDERLAKLENSRGVLSNNISSLLKTPAARALDAPVMVLFVPYTNADNVTPGEPIFSCALSIFVCSRVGDVGVPIRGETTAVHPLFGKPMRGTFMEATFNDAKGVTAELVHAGGRPLLF